MADESIVQPPEPEATPEPVVETPEPEAVVPEASADPMVDDADFDPVALVKTALGYDEFPDGTDVLARHITADRIANLPAEHRPVVVHMAARFDRLMRERDAKFAKEREEWTAKVEADKVEAEQRAASVDRQSAAFQSMIANPKAIERLRAKIAAKPENPDPNKPEDVTALAEAAAAEVALEAVQRQDHVTMQLRQQAERDSAYAKFGIKAGTPESRRVNEIMAQTFGSIDNVKALAQAAMARGKPDEVPLMVALRLYDAEVKAKATNTVAASKAADRADAQSHVSLRPGPRPETNLQSVWDQYLRSDPRLDNLSAALSGKLGADVQKAAKAYSAGAIA